MSSGSARVDVWLVALERPGRSVASLATLLSDDEADRAARFVFPADRRRFVVAHAALRAILAGYLGCAACDVRYRVGPAGKPVLADGASALRFNLTHAHELALVAVARERDVGVDVERMRDLPDLAAMAELVFSERERALFARRDALDRVRAFYTYWTRKEAYLKAVGVGLGFPVREVEVTLDRRRAALLRVGGDPREPRRWSLRALAPGSGYVGALAIEGTGAIRVVTRRWTGPAEAG